jgi:flagellar biosynthesis protein FlhF
MNPSPSPSQGTCYKFAVSSAQEAAAIIRERLGPSARVLSVRTLEASGLSRLWASPKLEVIAQVGPEGDGLDQVPEAAPQQEAAVPFQRPPILPPSLPSLLRRSGVSDTAIERLQGDSAWPALANLPLHRALVEVGQRLKAQAAGRGGNRPLCRAAFLGTAGSGRTTALCKWIGHEVFRNARSGHVVVAEFDRPNPVGGLPVFCEALGVPFARFPASTQPETPGGFVYLDMPAISLVDPSENASISEFLGRMHVEHRVLVLNAAYDHATLRSAYAAGRDLGATHLVFTHMDEVQQWGRLWEYLCDGALQPLFLATGPSLTGDCDDDVWAAFIRRTLAAGPSAPGAEGSSYDPAETPAALGGART